MFTGQGSQYYGMGYQLYQKNDVFRSCMKKLDEVVMDTAGYSVVSELYNQARIGTEFVSIQYTHPAIFMLEYSLAQTLISLNISPDCVLGSSLGEAAALAVAGCEEPERVLRFIVLQAILFKDSCKEGGMLTLLENYQSYEEFTIKKDGAEIVSINGNQHFVMSGTKKGIEGLYQFARRQKKSVYRLPVEFGFHCSCIDPAMEGFLEIADELYGRMADIPVYSCESGHAIKTFCYEDLWNIVRNPIRMRDALQNIKEIEGTILIDMSPQGTMAALAKMILERKEQIYSIFSQFNMEEENLAKLQTILANR